MIDIYDNTTSMLLRKPMLAELSSSDSAEGSFHGYASLWNTPDMSGDLVSPGAFRKAIDRRGVRGIRMLFQHDPNSPIGVWQEIREDKHGLYVRGTLTTGVRRSSEILSLIRSGALDGLSIGYRPVRVVRQKGSKRRTLADIDLWEISIVTFPMLPEARIHSVKNLQAEPVSDAPGTDYDSAQCLAAEMLIWADAVRYRNRIRRVGISSRLVEHPTL